MTPTPDAKTRSDRQIAEDIPYGVRIAAAWSWRVGLILVMIGILVWLLGKVSFLIIPVMVASLLAADPLEDRLRVRTPG